VSGAPTATRTITAILDQGPSPRVAAAGLDALAALARPDASGTVARYLRHRRASLRRHAVLAARAIHTPELIHGLLTLLGDPDESVRGDVADALSEIGNRSTTEALLVAFERDLNDASGPEGGRMTHPCALAVGRFGAPDEVERLLGFLGRAPFDVLTAAMLLAVRRNDLPSTLKVQIVNAFGRMATHDARVFLETVIADAHGQASPMVDAARDAASRISDSR
jgi:hypothetical protein